MLIHKGSEALQKEVIMLAEVLRIPLTEPAETLCRTVQHCTYNEYSTEMLKEFVQYCTYTFRATHTRTYSLV